MASNAQEGIFTEISPSLCKLEIEVNLNHLNICVGLGRLKNLYNSQKSANSKRNF